MSVIDNINTNVAQLAKPKTTSPKIFVRRNDPKITAVVSDGSYDDGGCLVFYDKWLSNGDIDDGRIKDKNIFNMLYKIKS